MARSNVFIGGEEYNKQNKKKLSRPFFGGGAVVLFGFYFVLLTPVLVQVFQTTEVTPAGCTRRVFRTMGWLVGIFGCQDARESEATSVARSCLSLHNP